MLKIKPNHAALVPLTSRGRWITRTKVFNDSLRLRPCHLLACWLDNNRFDCFLVCLVFAVWCLFCLFSLLKCVLARWFLGVMFDLFFCSKRKCDFLSRCGHFWCPSLSFDRRGAPFWYLGEHFGTLGELWEAIRAPERTPWGPESDFITFY